LLFIIKAYILNIQDTLNKIVNYAHCPCRCSDRALKSQGGGVETWDGSKAVIENVDDCLEKQNIQFCFRCRYGEVGGLLF